VSCVRGEVIRCRRDGGIACHEVYYAAGTRVAQHAHDAAFFGLAIDGRLLEVAGEEEFEYTPRSVMYRRAGEPHSNSAGPSGARCFILELDAGIESRYAIRLPASTLYASGGSLAAAMTSAYREFRHPDECSSLAIQGSLLHLLVIASRCRIEDSRERPAWLDRVRDVLYAKFQERLTLEEIAGEVGVAPSRVSTVFRSVYRRSLAEEQRRLRIDFACQQIVSDELSLADVALAAGFADQPHFSRTFKRITGMTPAQYRAMVRHPEPPDAAQDDGDATSSGCS